MYIILQKKQKEHKNKYIQLALHVLMATVLS